MSENIMEISAIKHAELSSSTDYIEHHVSKLDTLPGIAIKYGVEVSDIKRLNGLASDFQMYALSSLQIPLPGRHPPSEPLTLISRSNNPRCTASEPRLPLRKKIYPSFYSSKEKTSANDFAVFNGEHFEREKISSVKGLLHGCYDLKRSENPHRYEMEMLLFQSDTDAQPSTPPSVFRPPESRHSFLLNGDLPQTALRVGQQEKFEQRDLTLGNESSCTNVLSSEPNTSSNDSEIPKINRPSEKVFRRRINVEGGLETESEISVVRLLPFASPFAWASSDRTPIQESFNESKRSRGFLLGVEDFISKIRRSASKSNFSFLKLDGQQVSPTYRMKRTFLKFTHHTTKEMKNY